jgi:hypothetical protein
VEADRATWVRSKPFIEIYSRRGNHLASLGIDVAGLDVALEAASGLTAVGVVVEDDVLARFLSPDKSELGSVRLPSGERPQPG